MKEQLTTELQLDGYRWYRQGDYWRLVYTDGTEGTRFGFDGLILDEVMRLRAALVSSRQTCLAAVNRIDKLEAAIRRWASECSECGGTGIDEHRETGAPRECIDCQDIRELIS